MADVTLTYKGATVAELSDSGSKTLRTAGKFCEADIGVEYVKPSGGGDDPKALIRSRLTGTLTEYVDDQLTTVVDAAFNQCFNLTILRLHGLTKLASSWLGNIAVTTLAFPNVTSGWTNYSFNGAKKLKAVDFSKIPKVVSNGFNGTSVMDTLVLRNSTVVPLENINAFNSTKFKDGSTGGTLYVPQAHIAAYQAATNWSTILSYANNKIMPIEGSIYETQYADGTPIPTT